MSEGKDRKRGPYGRPAPGAKPGGARPSFGKPAGKGAPRGPYGRPAPKGSGARPKDDRRTGPYGRPAPKAPRPEPSLTGNARKAALDVLNRVILDGGYASLSLDEAFQKLRLSFKDRRLCTQIVYLTLENLRKLDFALARHLEAPEGLESRVRNLLRLSAAQILLLDRVPDSAAVNEAVKIAREMGLEELTGLVNGVLRNLIRQMDSIPWPKEEDGLIYYEVMHSQPQWLAEQILSDYGKETGHAILTWKPEEHFITIRRNTSRISQEDFEAMLQKKRWTAEPGTLPDAWRVKGAMDIGLDEDFQQGYFSVQGEGSTMAALALSPALGSQVLDCCAAPGGKTAVIAEHLQGTGRVHAWDVHGHRVDLIGAMATRLRLYNIRPAQKDALDLREQMIDTLDAIIIDAPCTGTGVMHEKPDIRLRLEESGLTALKETQMKLLDTVSQYLKPGGALVYATCSILPDENEKQVERFLSEHPNFSMAPLPDSIPAVFREKAGPFGLQLLPHRDGTEGFFIARMQKT